jgi:hypothetical protein
MILFIAWASDGNTLPRSNFFSNRRFSYLIETWKVIFRPFASAQEKPAAAANSQACRLVIDLEIIGPLQ